MLSTTRRSSLPPISPFYGESRFLRTTPAPVGEARHSERLQPSLASHAVANDSSPSWRATLLRTTPANRGETRSSERLEPHFCHHAVKVDVLIVFQRTTQTIPGETRRSERLEPLARVTP